MRILSVRHGFEADHSSSSYEFFALGKLTPEQRAAVQKLTGESPHRHLRFHHWGERSIPDEWEKKLLTLGYDIKVSYFTLVPGQRLPPAKFSIIAEHVWLLEKTGAPTTFLVLGNDRQVPLLWLERYGHLVGDVAFYFLTNKGELELLTEKTTQ